MSSHAQRKRLAHSVASAKDAQRCDSMAESVQPKISMRCDSCPTGLDMRGI
jgi:hypothetical protein